MRTYPVDQAILVVDDDPARRQRLVQILAGENFDVTAAAEGLAALRTLANRRFALIVAGLRLPGSLDGVATVRQARLRQPWLKALFTDAHGGRPHLGDRDSDDFITGPVERWELLGCVFELLQRGPAADLTRRARTERRAS